MDPVDPDEEFSREAADKHGASDSDAETPAENQSADVPERSPADDGTESTDDPVGAKSGWRVLPTSGEDISTNAEPASDANEIPSSDLDSVPTKATPEPPAALFDSAPAAGETAPTLNSGQLRSFEPVDAAPSRDVIPSPDINDSGASAESAIDPVIPPDSWPDGSSDFYAALQQAPLPVIDPLNTDAPISSPDTSSVKDRSSLSVDQTPSREGSLYDQGKHDTAPGTDGRSDQADPRPDAAPVERKEGAKRRAEIERFIENFYAQMARADALLSPPFDGGPPMARPIVLVSLDEEQMQAITNDALAESGSRFAKTAAELAQERVDEAFWLRDCEMRLVSRTLGGEAGGWRLEGREFLPFVSDLPPPAFGLQPFPEFFSHGFQQTNRRRPAAPAGRYSSSHRSGAPAVCERPR